MFMPEEFYLDPKTFVSACMDGAVSSKCVTSGPLLCFLCIAAGLWGGLVIGFVTEYYTSHSYTPVREVARSTETGAATNIIYGLALGYKSTIVPVGILAGVVFVAFSLMDMYGVALAALGMLGTLSTCLAIDVYGPICDNAGGIAEMAELPEGVRDKTDALDAAGQHHRSDWQGLRHRFRRARLPGAHRRVRDAHRGDGPRGEHAQPGGVRVPAHRVDAAVLVQRDDNEVGGRRGDGDGQGGEAPVRHHPGPAGGHARATPPTTRDASRSPPTRRCARWCRPPSL